MYFVYYILYNYRPCASPGLNGRSILNLRTTGLDEQTCAVLGKLLSVDRLFEQIDLADCALSDAGKYKNMIHVHHRKWYN